MKNAATFFKLFSDFIGVGEIAEWSAGYLIQAKSSVSNLDEALGSLLPSGMKLVKVGKPVAGSDIKFGDSGMNFVVTDVMKSFNGAMPL